MRIEWTMHARMDQIEIYETIAEDNSAAAEQLFQKFEESVSLLRANPRLGVRRPDVAPSARMLVVGAYLIYYENDPDTLGGSVDKVEIIGIQHSGRGPRRS